MRNSLLKVSGIFGISGDVEIHFPAKGLVAIQGENGAGKSSILDSLAVALFGEPTPARAVKNVDILSRSRDEGYVSLEFEWPFGGGTPPVKYKVDREFKRTKRGAVNHKAFLYELSPGGEPEGIATGPDAVTERIASIISGGTVLKEGAELIRIVRSAWLSSVFLPQGEVTRLLRMRPAERREIISALFGLEEGDVLKDRSKALLQVAEGEVRDSLAEEKLLKETLENCPVKSVTEGERALKEVSVQLSVLEKKRDEATARKGILESYAELKGDEKTLGQAVSEGAEKLKRMERALELEGGYRALTAVQEGARRLAGAAREREDCLRRAGETKRESEALEKEVAQLRSKREETEKALKEARPLALLAGDVKAIRELRESLRKIYADIKDKQARAAQVKAFRSGTLEALSRAVVKEASIELEKSRAVLKQAEQEVGVAGESLRDRLVDWLILLSGAPLGREGASSGAGSIKVADVQGMSGEAFARSLEDSRFSELLEKIGNARGTEEKARAKVIEGEARLKEAEREARDIQALLQERGAGALPDEFALHSPLGASADLDANELRKQATLLEKEESGIAGILSGMSATVADMKTRGMELSRRLGGADEDKCLEMERVARELTERLEQETRELERVVSLAGDKKTSVVALLGEATASGGAEARLREEYLALTTAWREQVKAWEREDFADMWASIQRYGVSANTREILEGERNKHSSLKGELSGVVARIERMEREFRDLPRSEEARTEFLREAEFVLRNAAQEYESAWKAKAEAERNLETYRELSGKLKETRKSMKSTLPAYEKARAVAKLLEGNNFGNFLQDRALGILLDFVNAGQTGYSFHSEGGNIMVTGDGGVRDAASLSGGEATMAALLLLRGMQAVSGIGGMMAIDEGFAQLDTKNLESVVETLSTLSADSLIIAITHDPDFAREFDTLWKVEQGGKITVLASSREKEQELE